MGFCNKFVSSDNFTFLIKLLGFVYVLDPYSNVYPYQTQRISFRSFFFC